MRRETENQLVRWDKRHVWHPFTQQAEWERERPLIIHSARGCHLYDTRGRRYIDGVSSLWVTVHGHRHPLLDRAVRRQLTKAAHTTFLGLTHEPAIRLAKALVDRAPSGLTRVFYSDNGATAVEVALKMAYQYWIQRNGNETSRRSEFLAIRNSYHGDTLGSVSVGGIGTFHKKFQPLLFKARFAMSPNCYRCPFRKRTVTGCLRTGEKITTRAPLHGQFRKETGCRWECLKDVEFILKKHSHRLAAAVVEPLVQGAAGIVVQPPGYMKGFERLCRRYGVLLIADEVATGFGRTGKMFAVEHESVKPDFLCLAKSLTGGYLPLAATLTHEKIYRAFWGRHEQFKTFFHGHTYTANPLGCAAALASLRLYKNENTLKKTRERARFLAGFLNGLRHLPYVGDVRQMGLMAGIELIRKKSKLSRGIASFPVKSNMGQRVCRAAREKGLWVRPLGDVLVVLPPLSIPWPSFRRMMRIVREAILDVAQKEMVRS